MPITVKEDVPLAPFTTLGVGGPARYFIEAREEGQLLEALDLADAREWPVFILGGGSNLLVSDEGYPGLVVKVAMKGIRFDEAGGAEASAGEEWDTFVQLCVDRNFAGVECLSGIPGTVGGTPIQNVGAYGQDVGQTVTSVRVLDRISKTIKSLGADECGFSYRSSRFNTGNSGRFIILSVAFSLKPGGRAGLEYRELAKRFAARGTPPAIAEVRQAVLEIRAAKGMLIRPGDPDCRSAGSFFKNPMVSGERASRIEQLARERGLLLPEERLPGFSAENENIKLPAAWLIEKSGFSRGYARGRAGLSTKHTLAIVNRGGATAGEILGLMREVQSGVNATFGIDLQPEPVFVGF